MDELYHQMLRIRLVEQRIAKKYPEGKMRCPIHLSIGQEAAAVGICHLLKKEDKLVSTHRGHAHYLAKGGSIKGLIGELYGKSSGCSKGAGGSMHLLSLDVGFYGSTSIVGGTAPVGVGLAFSDRLRGNPSKTVICLGDAAIEEGVFHEAANFASLHNLNILFALENNQYSCYTHLSERRKYHEGSFERIARAHSLDYMNAYTGRCMQIIEMIEKIKLPGLIEIPTWRHLQHCGPDNDDHLGYRPKKDVDSWLSRDEIRLMPWQAFNRFKPLIEKEIDEAFEHAETAEPAQYVSAYAN